MTPRHCVQTCLHITQLSYKRTHFGRLLTAEFVASIAAIVEAIAHTLRSYEYLIAHNANRVVAREERVLACAVAFVGAVYAMRHDDVRGAVGRVDRLVRSFSTHECAMLMIATESSRYTLAVTTREHILPYALGDVAREFVVANRTRHR